MAELDPAENRLYPGPAWTSHRFIDHPVMDDQMRHQVAMMYYGMSDLGECLEVARQIAPGDEHSWIDAWTAMAKGIQERAETAERAKKMVTAETAYLRASTYWRASLMHFGYHDDPRVREHSIASYQCYDRYLELSGYPGERLEIPYQDSFLHAYFYRSPVAEPKAPVLIFCQGRDAWPEDTRWVYDGAMRRGIHCLGYHGPGQGLSIRLNDLPFRPDWENVATPVVDFALGIDGIDQDRIGLMGLSFGGYLAPRAAAFDPRIKICVANPGVLNWGEMYFDHFPPEFVAAYEAGPEVFNPAIYSVMEKVPLNDWFFRDSLWKHGAETPYDLFQDLIACDLTPYVDQIECETLVMDGTEEQFSVGQAQKLYDSLSCPKDLMLFDQSTTAQLHCQNGANATAGEYMFDWLDERL